METSTCTGAFHGAGKHGGMSRSTLVRQLLLAVLLAWSNLALAQVVSVADGVRARLRADASVSGAILAVLPSGMQVRLLEESGEYVRVSAGEKHGWVARHLLAMEGLPDKNADEGGAIAAAAAPGGGEETRVRRDELALMREEQEKNTWHMIGTAAGIALASFFTGFWLRGEMFRQRYGWLRKRPCSIRGAELREDR